LCAIDARTRRLKKAGKWGVRELIRRTDSTRNQRIHQDFEMRNVLIATFGLAILGAFAAAQPAFAAVQCAPVCRTETATVQTPKGPVSGSHQVCEQSCTQTPPSSWGSATAFNKPFSPAAAPPLPRPK